MTGAKGQGAGVSADKDFEMVCVQVRYFHQKMSDAFNFWIRTFSAIVGGAIYLAINANLTAERIHNYKLLSDLIIIVLALVTMVMIEENLRAWRGYRKAQGRLKLDIPPPRPLWQCFSEWAMWFCVGISSALFCYFNPFEL